MRKSSSMPPTETAILLFGKKEADMLSEQENEYFTEIDRASKSMEPLDIANGSTRHARYIIYTLIKKAKSKLRIYSGNLTSENDHGEQIFGDANIIEAITSALTEKVNISVLTQDAVDDDHPALVAIRKLDESTQSRFKIRHIHPEIQELLNHHKIDQSHFVVADDKSYRYEIDHVACAATANFGDGDFAESLVSLFDSLDAWQAPARA